MSKALIFTDIHLHQHKKSSERLQDCLNVLDWIFKMAIEEGVDNILFLGDLFHDRQKIDALTYIKTFQIFESFCQQHPKINIYLLVGNHDLWFYQKTDISSVMPLRAFNNIHVVDSPCTLNLSAPHRTKNIYPISFLPYTHDPITDIKNIKNDSKFKMLVGHIAVDGAVLNSMHSTHAEVAIEHDGEMVKCGVGMFDGWDQVFLGHYHAEQQLTPNVEYVGSPLELSFGEAFQEKHIVVYNLETHEKKYIVNNFSPKHLIIPEKDLDKYDLKGNFVRLIVDNLAQSDLINLRNNVAQINPASLEITSKPKVIKEEVAMMEDAKAILFKEDEMLERYIKEMSENNLLNGLDVDALLKIGKTICQSCADV